MAGEITPIPLLRTKLHRPLGASDHLHRQRLLDRLNRHPSRPLTLVSAPAGYAKSTLVSCWLESCDVPSAWLSLDESDSAYSEPSAASRLKLVDIQVYHNLANQVIRKCMSSTDISKVLEVDDILVLSDQITNF